MVDTSVCTRLCTASTISDSKKSINLEGEVMKALLLLLCVCTFIDLYLDRLTSDSCYSLKNTTIQEKSIVYFIIFT